MHKFTFFLLGLLLISCNETTPSTQATSEPTTKTEETIPKNKQEAFDKIKSGLATTQKDFEGADMLPSIDISVLENLWENCDFVDYVYYELPISASLDNKNSIQSSIQHIAEQPAAKINGCKAIGRVFYQIEGENVLQGDIYFSRGCTYFLWLDDKGKYFAGNVMMDSALKFFASNIQAAMGKIPAKKE
ncbi:MAG: hypothetical protein ACI85O_003090 [Saprospiraceae bacterium]|jgi:hypothetical protein